MPQHSDIYRELQYQKERMDGFLRNPGTMSQQRRLELFEGAAKLIAAYQVYTEYLETQVSRLQDELGYEAE